MEDREQQSHKIETDERTDSRDRTRRQRDDHRHTAQPREESALHNRVSSDAGALAHRRGADGTGAFRQGRDHFCADPHLEGVDLRIATLAESAGGADPQMSAIREIDNAWDKWLADYLANHRCG